MLRIFNFISTYKKSRQQRMQLMQSRLGLEPQMRVLDLGGQPHIWDHVTVPLNIEIVNLPGIAQSASEKSIHNFTFTEGDACRTEDYDTSSYDVVFSNSVIEHVGNTEQQAAFSATVKKAAPKYWVQTPSPWFPLEPHTGKFFWWARSEASRQKTIEAWRKKVPAWTEMVETTTVLSKSDMHGFYPDAEIITERKFLFPKSYIALKT